MDFELTRTLTHAVLKSMLAHAQRDPGYAGQFGDMQLVSIASRVERLARDQGHLQPTAPFPPQEQNLVAQSLWELVIQGILVPNNADGGTQGWPFVSFTEHGKVAINVQSPTPYDPTGYLATFERADDIVRFYVEEALGCFRATRYTATAVMLGVASERLLDSLLEAFLVALASEHERQELSRRTAGKMVNVRYDELRKRLDPKKGHLPEGLRDNLDIPLVSIFNVIRQSRNDAGHPTGRAMGRDEANALLYVFPHYYKQLADLVRHLETNPNSLT